MLSSLTCSSAIMSAIYCAYVPLYALVVDGIPVRLMTGGLTNLLTDRLYPNYEKLEVGDDIDWFNDYATLTNYY